MISSSRKNPQPTKADCGFCIRLILSSDKFRKQQENSTINMVGIPAAFD